MAVVNLDMLVKQFAVGVIETQKLPLPVKVELLDLGGNPMYEMVVTSKSAQSLWQFSGERVITGTLARPKPWSVRFAASGQRTFVLDFPDEQEARSAGA